MTVVTQLTPNIGAEITEIDLSHPIDRSTANWLKDQLVKYKVIFFRDQTIDSQEHLNFAQLFGDLETHPVNPKEGFSEILVLHNHADNPPNDTAVWHSDVTWRDKPSLGSILVARKVPPLGGDTLFANMEQAYDGLDDQTKDLIEGGKAIHRFESLRVHLANSGASEGQMAKFAKKYPEQLHPIVRTHPVTRNKSIYVNSLFTVRIDGMREKDSQPLLKKLFASANKSEYQCRFTWKEGSIAFWDNRSVQHYACADYFPEERLMERVTIAGDKPF